MYNNQFFLYYSGGFLIEAGTPALNAWQHFALVRQGNVFTIYIDGAPIANATTTAAIGGATTQATIGGDPYYGQWHAGLLDDFRITRVARYTGTFTPPAAAF